MRTYALRDARGNCGIAVTGDGSRFFVSNNRTHTITVYSIADGSVVASFGGIGCGRGEFDSPQKLCISPKNRLLVAEHGNARVQEVSMTGEHIRFIGKGTVGLCGIACNEELIVVTKSSGVGPNRVVVIDYTTGDLVTQFGDHGSGNGQMRALCGARFTPDGQHIILVDTYDLGRLCMFTIAGAFVENIVDHDLNNGVGDVEFTADGDIVVPDFGDHCVRIFSRSDGSLLRSWGTEGTADGEFSYPTAVAVHGNELFVLDMHSARVQVFH